MSKLTESLNTQREEILKRIKDLERIKKLLNEEMDELRRRKAEIEASLSK